MSTQPLPLMPWVTPPYLKLDDDGVLVPNVGGKIYTYLTDLTTPAPTYQNATGTLVAHTNPITIDSDGYPPSKAIYLLPQGYSIIVKDSDLVTLATFDFVEDVGATAFASLGNFQASGTIATSSPYTVAATDQIVIVNAATPDPFVVHLPDVTTRTTQLLVKNISAVAVSVTPHGAQEIDAIAALVTVPAAGSPPVPGLLLYPAATAWWTVPGS